MYKSNHTKEIKIGGEYSTHVRAETCVGLQHCNRKTWREETTWEN